MFLAHAHGLRGMMFQLRHCCGRRDTAEKVLWCPSKVPFIIYRFQLLTIIRGLYCYKDKSSVSSNLSVHSKHVYISIIQQLIDVKFY